MCNHIVTYFGGYGIYALAIFGFYLHMTAYKAKNRKPYVPLVICIYTLAFSTFGHKEFRYCFPVYALLSIMVSVTLKMIWDKKSFLVKIFAVYYIYSFYEPYKQKQSLDSNYYHTLWDTLLELDPAPRSLRSKLVNEFPLFNMFHTQGDLPKVEFILNFGEWHWLYYGTPNAPYPWLATDVDDCLHLFYMKDIKGHPHLPEYYVYQEKEHIIYLIHTFCVDELLKYYDEKEKLIYTWALYKLKDEYNEEINI